MSDPVRTLLQLIRYIHQNPVRAKISDLNYWYSSHKDYTNIDHKVCEVEEVLSMFSDNKKRALREYIDFMDLSEKDIEGKKDRDLSPEFNEILLKINGIDEISIDFDDVVESFEEKNNINLNDLKGKYLKKELIKLRKSFIIESLDYKVITQKELGELFNITANHVSRIYNTKD